MTETKKKLSRKVLTIDERMEVIRFADEKHQNVRLIKKQFGISVTQIYDILRNRDRIQYQCENNMGHKKRLVKICDREMETTKTVEIKLEPVERPEFRRKKKKQRRKIAMLANVTVKPEPEPEPEENPEIEQNNEEAPTGASEASIRSPLSPQMPVVTSSESSGRVTATTEIQRELSKLRAMIEQYEQKYGAGFTDTTDNTIDCVIKWQVQPPSNAIFWNISRNIQFSANYDQ